MNTCYSCSAPIIWTRTRKKRIPLDVNGPHEDGNLLFVDANTVVALNKDELASAKEKGKPLFRSHFVTCPNAKQHRRRETA